MDHLQRTFDYVAEHPGESIFAIGVVVVAVMVVPSDIAAAGAELTAKLLGGLTSILIGVSIFNDKGK